MIILIFVILLSTSLYLFLYKKTRIDVKYIFIDNIIVIVLSSVPIYLFNSGTLSYYLIPLILIPVLIFSFTMLRFWRTPARKVQAKENQIVSPADGKVIYIKKLEKNVIPVSIKNKVISEISEITKTDLLKVPCWLIGINMTPFDVHKNCAPVSGKVILNQHFNGKFSSLKDKESETENERNTYIIENENFQVGVIQIASKRVRRIDTYVEEGSYVKKGNWLGMIRFGSQVDLIIPINTDLKVKIGQQVYAVKTIIADLK